MTLQDIQQSFSTRSFDIAEVGSWLTGVGVIVLLILAYLAYKAIQARRFRYKPYGSVSDPKTIRRLIQEAVDQRRPFEVQITSSSGRRRPTLRCSPHFLKQNVLVVEINGLNHLSQRWLERQVSVYFRVLHNKKFAYYTFPARIAAIHQEAQNICLIELPVPPVLENRQKRAFLRIKPPHDFILGSALWCNDSMPKPDNLHELDQWPPPKLLHLPDRAQQFKLLDISAGGCRVEISNKIIRTYQLHFTSIEYLIIMLDLFDPEQNKRLRLWMLCRIQNLWREHVSRDIQMGMQFIAWARPKDTGDFGGETGSVEWLRISSSNEVDPLGNWIMRRHLELFREAPVDQDER